MVGFEKQFANVIGQIQQQTFFLKHRTFFYYASLLQSIVVRCVSSADAGTWWSS